MKFTQVEPNENFPAGRWVSEQQRWEIGFCPVMFGVRVRFGQIGSNCVELDYCAGADATFALILLATVVQILSTVPETASSQEIRQMFPTYTVKPIDRDPFCWERLKEMAAEVVN